MTGHTPRNRHHHEHHSVADLLDLDAAVMGGYHAEMITAISRLCPREPRTIVDLGAGTGSGSIALAAAFPTARVIAVDSDQHMITRLAAVGNSRITPVFADLDDGWPTAAGDADVIWASSSLHHFADPDAALGAAHAHLQPGGVLAVVEIPHPPTFLNPAQDDPIVGLEDRIAALMQHGQWNTFPDWATHIADAGFGSATRIELRTDTTEPGELVARYADEWLRRVQARLTDTLSPADSSAIAALLDTQSPNSLRHRTLRARSTRLAWLAQRSHTGSIHAGSRDIPAMKHTAPKPGRTTPGGLT